MKYHMQGKITVPVKITVEATSEKEALRIARERNLVICLHGAEDNESHFEWKYQWNEFERDFPKIIEVETKSE